MKEFFDLPREYVSIIKRLDTPRKVQDFLNKDIEMNFEPKGDTCFSPLTVLKTKKAHCIEGALLAAIILRYHGQKPLLLDLEANDPDYDHVVTLFKKDNCWGAISKTNHAFLRYRDPIYKTIRELVLSYFNEYFLDTTGTKTLRKYSNPINLKKFDKTNWVTSKEDVWEIPEYLTKVKHHKILTKKQVQNLRKADAIEQKAAQIEEYEELKK